MMKRFKRIKGRTSSRTGNKQLRKKFPCRTLAGRTKTGNGKTTARRLTRRFTLRAFRKQFPHLKPERVRQMWESPERVLVQLGR